MFRHAQGDQLVQRATYFLVSNFIGYDIFRLGGDEFVVVTRRQDVNGDTDLNSFYQLNQTANQTNLRAYNNNQPDMDLPLSMSFGTSICTNPQSKDELLLAFSDSDERMYQSKNLRKQQLDAKLGINQ